MDEKIIEKIKKLLLLGQNPNRAEAELAVERAFELAAKHSIDVATLDLDEEMKRILHKRFRIGQRLSLMRKLAANLVANFFNVNVFIFNVNVVISRPDVILIGTEVDIEMARYVMEFVAAACARELRKYSDAQMRRLTENKRKNFIVGFFYGLASKLRQARKTLQITDATNALILASEARREKYQEDMDLDLRPLDVDKGRKNRSAIIMGYMAGESIEINKAVSNKRTEGRLLE